MSDNIQPNNNNHYPKYHNFTIGGTPVDNVERSRSVNTPAPAGSASASVSASAADSGRPTNAALDAISAVANNANNAIVSGIVSVADKAFAALGANADKDGTITRKREHKIPVPEDEGCSKSKKVKQEASEYKAK